jgi:hypothetical protein
MMVPIGDSLSYIASSNDGEDGEENNDKDLAQGKLSEDDQPRWVMGRIFKTVQQQMERFHQTEVKLDDLTPQGWGDAAD